MECTNATRQRPCHLCAQLGHEGRDCPNRESLLSLFYPCLFLPFDCLPCVCSCFSLFFLSLFVC